MLTRTFPLPAWRHAWAILFVALLAGCAGRESSAEPPALKWAFGPEGLSSLSYQGAELLVQGPASLSAAAVTAGGKTVGINGNKEARTTVNGRTITRTCQGLTVVMAMEQEKDILRMTVTFHNTGTNPLTRVSFSPFTLQFPSRPRGGRWKWGYRAATTNKGAPGVVEADYGPTKVLACVDEIERPVTFGFEGNYGNATTNAIVIETAKGDPIPPDGKKTFRFSLRFAPGGTPTFSVAEDIYRQFAKAYPYKLNWPDRRPIGAIMACQSAMHWPTNPRGWLNDPKIDVTTEEGRKAFGERMLKYADTAVGVIKDTGGQGMIFWSVEGEQMPHAITYLGDPRILPRSAPEMDAVADEFFKRFRDAGLKVGVCIRPSRIVSDGKGGWNHVQVDDPVAEMSDKIEYAKKRWGCTIFYMDTNVRWEKGMWQGASELLSARDLYELTRRHGDVLIFPEFGTFGYWSCCMPYGELRGGTTRTAGVLRAVYPRAGTTIAAQDGDYMGHYDSLLAGVLQGDIQLFRGWFGDPRNQEVKLLYLEADYVRQAAAEPLKDVALSEALAAPDPLVRYKALALVQPADRSAMALVMKHAPAEKHWVVLKKMVALLAESKDPAAVGVLTALVKDKPRNMDHFAAVALGRLGPLATDALLQLAADPDARTVAKALLALSAYEDAKALPAILPLADSDSAPVRLVAIRALAAQHGDASVNKLISLLAEEDVNVVGAACSALGRLKDRRAVKPLVETIERAVTKMRNNTVRAAAGDALEAITGQELGPYEARWRRALDAGKL